MHDDEDRPKRPPWVRRLAQGEHRRVLPLPDAGDPDVARVRALVEARLLGNRRGDAQSRLADILWAAGECERAIEVVRAALDSHRGAGAGFEPDCELLERWLAEHRTTR